MTMLVTSILSNRNYIVINRDVLSKLGINATLMLGELAYEYDSYARNGKLEDGMFYSTIENIKSWTNLSRHQQDEAIKTLCDHELIECKVKGLPAKRYFRIREDKLVELIKEECEFLAPEIANFEQDALSDFGKLDSQFLATNNKTINNKKINNKKIINNTYSSLSDFTEFYNSYPKKVGKAQAQKAFAKVCKSETDFAAIMAGLSKQNELKFEPMIAAGQKQYIPYPATWLNERRWEDEVEPFKQSGKETISVFDL